MIWLRKFAAAIWNFVVGDDWRLAAGAVILLGGAAALVALDIDAWWFAPLGVPAILAVSVRSAATQR